MTDYFVFTDLHGSAESMQRLSELIMAEAPGVVISLGDVNYSGARNDPPRGYAPKSVCALLKEIRVPVIYIKGNCDSEIDETVIGVPFDERRLINIGGRRVLFTHGHRLNPSVPPPAGYADAVVYGHTHVNAVWRVGGVTFVNLSSLSLPKGGSEPAYAVIMDGFAFIKNLQGNIIERIEL